MHVYVISTFHKYGFDFLIIQDTLKNLTLEWLTLVQQQKFMNIEMKRS
jgi:hypothetical protein